MTPPDVRNGSRTRGARFAPLPGPAPLVSPMSHPDRHGRPAVALTLAVLTVMAIASGLRSLLASARGMDIVPDKVAVMSMRAAANEFGYLVGAAGGLAAPERTGNQGPSGRRLIRRRAGRLDHA
jgi:hypothetical protein